MAAAPAAAARGQEAQEEGHRRRDPPARRRPRVQVPPPQAQAGASQGLALDGGGVRAIAGVVFLKQLEVATGKSIFDLFDMFIGTSAGGMNALLVAMKKA